MRPFLILLILAVPLVGFAQPYTPAMTESPQGTVRGGGAACDFDNPVLNCGFESGDYTSWVTSDLTAPFFPLSVDPGGTDLGFGFFVSAPLQDGFSAFHGFDGDGPGTIEIAQDITLPGDSQTLQFAYRGAWDLATFGATIDRTFEVQVQPAGGGAPLQSDLILTAAAGTIVNDTGPSTGAVDVSSFAGQAVRLAFVWTVPENLSGPAQFELDSVVLGGAPTAVPSLNTLGLVLMILLLGGAGLWMMRKRIRA